MNREDPGLAIFAAIRSAARRDAARLARIQLQCETAIVLAAALLIVNSLVAGWMGAA